MQCSSGEPPAIIHLAYKGFEVANGYRQGEGGAPPRPQEVAMTIPLGFDALQDILHRQINQLPDYRIPGPNTRYRIQDAALGALGLFYTQSPSFLDSQRHLQQAKGHHNVATLFGIEPPIRTTLHVIE